MKKQPASAESETVSVSALRFADGVWHGVASRPQRRSSKAGAPPPELDAVLHVTPAFGVEASEIPLTDLTIVPVSDKPGAWNLALGIPAAALGDGLRTVMIRDTASGAVLAGFSIVAGPPLEGDAMAELALMRAELDMLKSAFRRLAAKS